MPARRTTDTRLADSQANLRARRAGPTGIGKRAGRLPAPDPLRGANACRQHPMGSKGWRAVPGDTTATPSPWQWLVNSHGGFDRNSGPMIVQQRLLYRRSACTTIHAWRRAQRALLPLCSRRSRYVLRPVAECPDGKMRPTWSRRARREPQSAWVCELPWSVCWWSESRRKQLASQEFGWRTLSGSSSSRAGSLSPAAVTQVIGGQFRNHGCTSRPAPAGACPPARRVPSSCRAGRG